MSFTSNSPNFWPVVGYDDLHFRFSGKSLVFFVHVLGVHFRTLAVASTAIIFYDYGLVFTREVELVWRQRWKLTTVLYIIARYLGLAIAIVQILGEAPGILLSDTEHVLLATNLLQSIY
ncbi:hypothetical protein F4604DRAFT_71131 [Suillus subluteus]|nr:hypothetical protein F4604DRAFT_71131 [Suillus subluteus]